MAHKIKTVTIAILCLAGIGAFLTFAPPDPLQTEAPHAPVPELQNAEAPGCVGETEIGQRPAPLKSLPKVLASDEPLTVLLVGSAAYDETPFGSKDSYPDQLETYLKSLLKRENIALRARNIYGEVAREAGMRLRAEVAETDPDLIIWQVGVTDALARVDQREFERAFTETLDWLTGNGIDVVLIDPRYVPELAEDSAYRRIVGAIWYYAAKRKIPLVRRYEMMRDLTFSDGNKSPLGYQLTSFDNRCMARSVAELIDVSSNKKPAEKQQN